MKRGKKGAKWGVEKRSKTLTWFWGSGEVLGKRSTKS